jgi:hypothetical protein
MNKTILDILKSHGVVKPHTSFQELEAMHQAGLGIVYTVLDEIVAQKNSVAGESEDYDQALEDIYCTVSHLFGLATDEDDEDF